MSRIFRRADTSIRHATQLTQLILNLGTNARDAIGDRGGTITLRTAVADAARHVTLEVVDDGAGIDEAARQHLFERFFTTRPEGRGLGLSTVSAVAKAHGAIIDVLSTLGQGSTFRVAFPATTRRARASDVMSGPAPVTGAEQASEAIGLVLVADDESLVRTLTAAFVKRFGGTTLEAADGAEALRIVSERGADLDAAILDLTMPGASGLDVLAALRKVRPDLPVLLVTGYSSENVAARVPSDPRVSVLTKPFTTAQMRDALSALRAEPGSVDSPR